VFSPRSVTPVTARCWLIGAGLLLMAVPVPGRMAVAVLLPNHPGRAWGDTAFVVTFFVLPTDVMVVAACYLRTFGR
jgi:hypothetical protein